MEVQTSNAPELALTEPVATDRKPGAVPAQASDSGGGGCASCGNGAAASRSFVYALGRIEPRFPTLAVEKEIAQVTGRSDTAGLTQRQALQEVLAKRENRYLVRKLCWVLSIEGLETYILQPRDPADYDVLVEALRPVPRPTDIDVVVGLRGPVAPPAFCNGLMLPMVAFDQIYSFDVDALIKAIPRPESIQADKFEPAAEELFTSIIQLADNAGATDEHRAVNYLAIRYPSLYATAADALGRNFALTGVEVRPSRLSGVRNVVDVVFSFRNRATDVAEAYFVRVDVTEEFPFLVTKMSPYYER
jgi:PatG Domain